jgi:hypothetical protein
LHIHLPGLSAATPLHIIIPDIFLTNANRVYRVLLQVYTPASDSYQTVCVNSLKTFSPTVNTFV